MDLSLFINLLVRTISLGTPIALTGLGEGFSQKAGPLNLGIIGYLSLGAYVSWVIAYKFQNPWLATVIAMLAAALLAAFVAFLVVTLKLSQIVVGIGTAFFAEGLVCLLTFIVWPNYLIPTSTNVAVFQGAGIPFLQDIEIIGQVLFGHHIFVYIMVAIAILFNYIINKTKFGLQMRAVGESAAAADAMGINLSKIRYICIIVCGALCGLAASYMTLVRARAYVLGITADVGFIALAAIVLGAWKSPQIVFAAFLFGFVRSLHFLGQAQRWINIPSEVWHMLPYIVAILVLTISSIRIGAEAPRELARTYIREEEA